MSWATERRVVIVVIGAAFIVAVLALILIPTLYRAPSCTDSVQNQGEQGVDCGGPCAYLCAEQEAAPVVSLERALVQTPGRVDVIAYIENPNVSAAARNVAYTITLYAADHTVLRTAGGTLDLPALARVPLYAPAFFSGNSVAGVQAFVQINSASLKWFTSAQLPLPSVSNIKLGGTVAAPRITATLSNASALPYTGVKATVVVYDSSKNVIAASETLLPMIPGQGGATATFTWPVAFHTTPALIEVTPVPSFP